MHSHTKLLRQVIKSKMNTVYHEKRTSTKNCYVIETDTELCTGLMFKIKAKSLDREKICTKRSLKCRGNLGSLV